MHKLIALVFMVSLSAVAQTQKSSEVLRDPFSPETAIEERKVRQEWDREEQEAQAEEEDQRALDEERAETDEVTPRQ